MNLPSRLASLAAGVAGPDESDGSDAAFRGLPRAEWIARATAEVLVALGRGSMATPPDRVAAIADLPPDERSRRLHVLITEARSAAGPFGAGR